jgi:ribonuclease HI
LRYLRRTEPDLRVETKWCPSHKGTAGNEKADEWAKVAAETPD